MAHCASIDPNQGPLPRFFHRTEFPAFPFKPYGIQKDFMAALYATLDLRRIGIFESPTGTGKTLSLICSSLQWLQDEQLKVVEEKARQKALTDESAEPDWMKDFGVKKEETSKKQKDERRERRRARVAKEKERLRLEARKGTSGRKVLDKQGDDDSEDAFVLDDWESEDEKGGAGGKKREKDLSTFSTDESESEEETEPMTKVYFCSRTHSQLSQFVGELKRTSFNQSDLQTTSIASRKNLCINEAVLRLGSSTRINERCLELQKDKSKAPSSKLASAPSGGKPKTSKSSKGGCPYLAQQKLQRSFRDHVLESEPLDIEDLARLGRRIGTCPYYGARRALPTADLVALPYQSLLHKSTRETLGINLKDSVVIFDEAHNLVDAVTAIHSSLVTGQQLVTVHGQLRNYLTRFSNRLAAGNRRHIQTLLTLTGAFLRRLCLTKEGDFSPPKAAPQSPMTSAGASADASAAGEVMALNDFLFSLHIDNVNLFRLERYVRESNAVHKISGYGERQQQAQSGADGTDTGHSSAIGSFQAVAAFIVALTSTDSDGRVIVTSAKPGGQSHEGTLKFVMLNAAKHFQPIVNEARAIILAGGTLQPTSELRERLFPQVPDARLHFFSCGHIVPRESILPIAVRQGPTGRPFDFRFESRSAPAMIEELGRLLNTLCNVLPGGLVCFFPSFSYADQVTKAWEAAGTLTSICAKKTVFIEPRTAAEVESTLERYRACITGAGGNSNSGGIRSSSGIVTSGGIPASSGVSNGGGSGLFGARSQARGAGKQGGKGGAVLLSVVGGKMSEGINFSDDMGRCVVMVGLPYPSKADPELQERMQYLERGLDLTQLGVTDEGAKEGFEGARAQEMRRGRGHEYYENLCMKAVNQSIGRAIRHAGDYASILLVDHRYATSSGPVKKLPGWIQESLVTATSFGEAYKNLHQFFRARELQN